MSQRRENLEKNREDGQTDRERDQQSKRIKSALDEYSQLMTDHKLRKLMNSNISNQVFQPKIDYINDLVGQHLLTKEYTNTFRQLSEDAERAQTESVKRVYTDTVSEMKDHMLTCFYKGQEMEYFKARERLFDELNYYKLEFKRSDALELKSRAYFFVFPMIPMNRKTNNIEDLIRQTMERSDSYNKYLTEKGSLFMDDPNYKDYLKLSYLIQTVAKDDLLLEELLSDEFPMKLMQEITKETDAIIFYVNKITKNRSYLTKAFEYCLKNNDGFNSHSISDVYKKVNLNFDLCKQEIDKVSADIEEIDEMTAKMEAMRARKEAQLREKQEALEKGCPGNISLIKGVCVSDMTEGQKYLNWQYMDLFNQLTNIQKQMKDNPDPKKKRLLEIEYRKIRQMIIKPVGY